MNSFDVPVHVILLYTFRGRGFSARIGALALSTLKAEKDDRDYDDIVIKFVQKVGDRTISTSDRSFAKACGLGVIKRDKEAVAK